MFYGYVFKLSADAEPEVRIFNSERESQESIIRVMRRFDDVERAAFLASVSLIAPA